MRTVVTFKDGSSVVMNGALPNFDTTQGGQQWEFYIMSTEPHNSEPITDRKRLDSVVSIVVTP